MGNIFPDQEYPFAKFYMELQDISRIDLAIIRSHLYLENYIDEIFRIHLANSEDIINEFTFHQKFRVLEGLEVLNTDILENIKLLNGMRNDFAHNLDTNSIYEEKVKPKLGQLNWMDEQAKGVEKSVELDEPIFKISLTLAAINNYVAERRSW